MISDQEKLFKEFTQNREALHVMITDLEKFKEQVNELFPDRFDNRYKYLFDEKIKSITGFFNSLLDVRKEINKSLKDEIELKRKLEKEEEDYEKELNIGELATQIKLLNKSKESVNVG